MSTIEERIAEARELMQWSAGKNIERAQTHIGIGELSKAISELMLAQRYLAVDKALEEVTYE